MNTPLRARHGGGCRLSDGSRGARWQRRRGFQFIEALLSIVLVAILFVVGMAVSQTLVGVRKIHDYEVAIALANQAVEAMRAARFRELGADDDHRKDTLQADFKSENNPFDGRLGEGFVPRQEIKGVVYEREVFLTDVPSLIDGMPPAAKLARVRVRWRAPDTREALVYEVVTVLSDQW